MKRDRKRSQSGNAVLEFAASWAMLSIMFTGIFQYGYSFWVYNRLSVAVTNGAMYASALNFDKDDPAGFDTEIKNMVLYSDPAGGTTPTVSGLTASQISVDRHSSGGFPTNITVSVSNFTVNAIFGKQTFTGKPKVTVRWNGFVVCGSC